MPYEMKSMLELMNEALAKTKSKYPSVGDFITDGAKSQDFIDYMMDLSTSHFTGKKSEIYHYSQERARHIAVTFLVGMVFSEFCGFYKSLPSILNCDDLSDDKKADLSQRMWLITSLSHDNGYRNKKNAGKFGFEYGNKISEIFAD